MTGRDSNIHSLAPFVAARADLALAECHIQGFQLEIFEGYRTPQRQDELYAIGRTMPGKKVTNKRAWESWHNWNLACDIAYFYGNKRWSWDGDFDAPAAIFERHGFEWLFPYEKCHFQITGGYTVNDARKFESRELFWAAVEARVLRQNHPDH